MLREIFTWWNGQTIGTRIWSYFNGVLVGTDDQGNKYYKNKKDTKRWVIYNSIIESTLVNRNGTTGLDTLHHQSHQNLKNMIGR